MFELFSLFSVLLILWLAYKDGKNNQYPYLGDIDLNNDEEND
jgi:hypothetical protein